MTKDEIADTLEAIAQLLDLKGENPFKIRAYQTAARASKPTPATWKKPPREGELGDIEGVGKAIAEKIGELIETGRLGYFEELKGSFPPRIFELFEINGLGAKKIKVLHEKLGVASLDDLEAACRDGRVAELPGFGEKTAKNLLSAIEQRVRNAAFHRLGDVAGLAFQHARKSARAPGRHPRQRGRQFPAAQGGRARPGFRRVHAGRRRRWAISSPRGRRWRRSSRTGRRRWPCG